MPNRYTPCYVSTFGLPLLQAVPRVARSYVPCTWAEQERSLIRVVRTCYFVQKPAWTRNKSGLRILKSAKRVHGPLTG